MAKKIQLTPEEELKATLEYIEANSSSGGQAMAWKYFQAIRLAIYYVKDFDQAVRRITDMVSRRDIVAWAGPDAVSVERTVHATCSAAQHAHFVELFEPAVATWTPAQQKTWRKFTSPDAP